MAKKNNPHNAIAAAAKKMITAPVSNNTAEVKAAEAIRTNERRKAERQRVIEVQKAAAERKAAEEQRVAQQQAQQPAQPPVKEPEQQKDEDAPKFSIAFRITGTAEQINALDEFLKANNLKYEIIK